MRGDEPVNRLMTEAVLSVDAEEPAGEVLRLFRDYPVHHLPVVSDRRVIGMLSSADLLKLRAMLPKSLVSVEDYLNEKMQVRALISRPPVTIAQHDTVERAAELMARHAIHSLPVVDPAGHLVGILTTTDIISAMFDPAPGRADVVFDAHPRGARMTREQLGRAVALATKAVNEGHDPDGFAAALLHAQHRIALLEGVAALAARYLSSGQDVGLHTALGKAIERARASQVSQHSEVQTPGLGAA
jgi:CBS domain-containing protein